MAEVRMEVVAKQCCPRRQEAFQRPVAAGELPDRWERRHYPDHPGVMGNGEVCCSYCGSLSPEVFLDYVRQGWVVSPTDKSYKCYVEPPATEEDYESAYLRWRERHSQQLYQRLALSQSEDEIRAAWEETEKMFVHGSGPRGKFYFQHLSWEQKVEFVDLYNARTMVIGHPGYFYSKPYFFM